MGGGARAHAAGPADPVLVSHPAVRPFLRVNAWEGVDWFHRESFDELLAWVDRLEWILAPEDERRPRPDAGAAAPPSALQASLTSAADSAGYRVDRLREALGAGAPEPAAEVAPAKARKPRATRATAVAVEPAPEPEPEPVVEPLPEPETAPKVAKVAKPKKAVKPKKAARVDKGKKPKKK